MAVRRFVPGGDTTSLSCGQGHHVVMWPAVQTPNLLRMIVCECVRMWCEYGANVCESGANVVRMWREYGVNVRRLTVSHGH